MPIRRVRIALLSDLHAYHPAPGSTQAGPSYLPTNPGVTDPDPFGDLDKLVERETLRVDLILCGGDISDKADLRGFQYAWERLNALKRKLGAEHLIATCGNHDLNSRHIAADEDPDPKGALQTVEPQFPFEDARLTDHFWARNFAILSPLPGVSVVVLNTSAYHGGKDDELHHGRVSQRTISAIEKQLQAADQADLNVLLCHHHVRPLQGIWANAPDPEYMKKGTELLGMLTKCTASPWLVLHGHRHIPNLEHSLDPACVVVGASSFSGQLQGGLNQFHILDIEVDEGAGQPMRGTIDTWSWNRPTGWSRRHTASEDGFPPYCGFGSTSLPRGIVVRIEQALGSAPAYMEWNDLVAQVPDIKYMTPAHFQQVEVLLERAKISLMRDREGRVSQVGRTK